MCSHNSTYESDSDARSGGPAPIAVWIDAGGLFVMPRAGFEIVQCGEGTTHVVADLGRGLHIAGAGAGYGGIGQPRDFGGVVRLGCGGPGECCETFAEVEVAKIGREGLAGLLAFDGLFGPAERFGRIVLAQQTELS